MSKRNYTAIFFTDNLFYSVVIKSLSYIFLITLLSGCQKELFEQPLRLGADDTTFEASPSNIGAKANIPLAELQRLVNNKVPTSYSDSGNGADACVRILGIKTCAGTKYSYKVSRQGSIALSRIDSNTLGGTVVMSIKGKGGFRGDGAKLTGLDAKNFDAKVRIATSIRPEIRSDWCPIMNVGIDYSWVNNPRVEIVKGVFINVKDDVEKEINKALPGLLSDIRNTINCEDFKSQLTSFYGSKAFPIKLNNDGDEVFANLQPTDFSFSGITVTPTEVSTSAILTANIEISSDAIKEELLPLPPLQTISMDSPLLRLSVPVKPDYELISKLFNAEFSEKRFTLNSDYGETVIEVNGVEVYPSKSKVVIGIDMTADLPTSFFDTSGVVYLLAKPTIDENIIKFTDIEFAQTLDNDFWDIASVVFESRIKQAFSEAVVVDLSEQVSKAKARLNEAFEDEELSPDLKIKLTEVNMRLGRFAIAESHLAVEALFSARANISPRLE